MVDIADTSLARGASIADAADRRSRQAASDTAIQPLTAISEDAWRLLAARAIEPNGYYLPGWELAVNASAVGRTGTSALAAWSDAAPSAQLTGLLPVISMWRAYRIPLPALVSGHPYGTLCTPLLDADHAEAGAAALIRSAREVGAHALILREVATEGAAMAAISAALQREGLRPRPLQSHVRACLDATRDSEELLQEALGAKKLKELRRQRNRLADHGAISFDVARSPDDVRAATEIFLALEASGWKAQRGTALIQSEGDTAFIRRATPALAATRQCEVITLRAGTTPIASGVVLRHLDRAFYFKIGVDERFSKFSPGVQLTLDLTKHLCGDPDIASADSTAGPDHPMINPIWRGRLAIGDVLVPLRRNDPMVPLIEMAWRGRQLARDLARRGVHWLRQRTKPAPTPPPAR